MDPRAKDRRRGREGEGERERVSERKKERENTNQHKDGLRTARVRRNRIDRNGKTQKINEVTAILFNTTKKKTREFCINHSEISMCVCVKKLLSKQILTGLSQAKRKKSNLV